MGAVRITVEDLETGVREQRLVTDGDYFVLTTGDCRVERIQQWSGGTVQLTIKDHHPRPLSEVEEAGTAR